MNIPLRSRSGRLPLNLEFTPVGYRSLLLQRMKLFLSGEDVILGSDDAAEPSRNAGAWSPRATFSDGVTNSTATFTSNTALFTFADLHLPIYDSGVNIPANTYIGIVNTDPAGLAISVGLSSSATANVPVSALTTATGITFDIGRPKSKSWWTWDDETAQYLPVEIGFKNGNFGTTINASPAANRTITFPDTTGTVAFTADIYVPRETVVLSGTTPTIDASLSENFILTLTGNTTVQPITNMPPGGKIKVGIINAGTSYTVTWPSAGADAIQWPAGAAPTQPIAVAGQQALGIYQIREATIGVLVSHYWGETESSGYTTGTPEVSTGGPSEASPYYGAGDGVPPPKTRMPYNIP